MLQINSRNKGTPFRVCVPLLRDGDVNGWCFGGERLGSRSAIQRGVGGVWQLEIKLFHPHPRIRYGAGSNPLAPQRIYDPEGADRGR